MLQSSVTAKRRVLQYVAVECVAVSCSVVCLQQGASAAETTAVNES